MGNAESQREPTRPEPQEEPTGSSGGSLGRRKSSLLGKLRSRTPPETDLKEAGRELFAETLSAGENEPDSTSLHSSNESLAMIGMIVLREGMGAGNKARIQAFVKNLAPVCADCIDGDSPRWCGMMFGVFLCDDCAGAHRSLPATVTGGVRSLFLDDWSKEQVENIILKGGNVQVNEILEYHVPDTIRKPRRNVTSSNNRKRWMREKYERQAFKKSAGLLPKPAQIDQVDLSDARTDSFTGGRQVMVGVIDVTVLEVLKLPKNFINTQRLFGGFVLHFHLGRFNAATQSSWSGRKWLGRKIHLSWDGVSPLEIRLATGSKRRIGKQSVSLSNFLVKDSDTPQQDLKIVINPEAGALVDIISGGLDPITLVLRLEFMDLRS